MFAHRVYEVIPYLPSISAGFALFAAPFGIMLAHAILISEETFCFEDERVVTLLLIVIHICNFSLSASALYGVLSFFKWLGVGL